MTSTELFETYDATKQRLAVAKEELKALYAALESVARTARRNGENWQEAIASHKQVVAEAEQAIAQLEAQAEQERLEAQLADSREIEEQLEASQKPVQVEDSKEVATMTTLENVQAGDIVIRRVYGDKTIEETIERTTKTLIILSNDRRYRRNGYRVGGGSLSDDYIEVPTQEPEPTKTETRYRVRIKTFENKIKSYPASTKKEAEEIFSRESHPLHSPMENYQVQLQDSGRERTEWSLSVQCDLTRCGCNSRTREEYEAWKLAQVKPQQPEHDLGPFEPAESQDIRESGRETPTTRCCTCGEIRIVDAEGECEECYNLPDMIEEPLTDEQRDAVLAQRRAESAEYLERIDAETQAHIQEEMAQMSTWEMRARLEDLNNLLDGRTKHTPQEEEKLLREAMQLCEGLGLDRAWHRFHALLERIERTQPVQRQEELQHMEYQEHLDPSVFTRPRRNWQAKIRIKHLLTDDDDLTPQQINEIGNKIATALKHCPSFDGEDEIVTDFERVDDYDEFNSLLDDMYDACDSLHIWVG